MRRLLFGTACAVAVIGCSSGNADSAANGRVMIVGGCVTQSGSGTYILAPKAPSGSGTVGTSGTRQQRYQLIDETNVGVARWVNREATVTGKVEKAARANATTADDPNGAMVTNLPTLRVAQLNGGGDCTPAQ